MPTKYFQVCGELEDFLKESDREVYMRQLTEYEDWLYDEGEDCEKNVYKDKLELLKLVSHCISLMINLKVIKSCLRLHQFHLQSIQPILHSCYFPFDS